MNKKLALLMTLALFSIGLNTTSQAATVNLEEENDDITLRKSRTLTITADEPVDIGSPYGLTTASISIFNNDDDTINAFLELGGGAQFDLCRKSCKADANFDGVPHRIKLYGNTRGSSSEVVKSILTIGGDTIYARPFFTKELLKPQVIKIRMPIYPNKFADYTFTIKEPIDIKKLMPLF